MEEEDFRTIKTGLRNLLRDPDTFLPILEDAVLRTNDIVTRGWFFLKLYMLQSPSVKVTLTLAELVLKVVSVGVRKKKYTENAVLMSELQVVYRTSFQSLLPLGDRTPSRKGLNQVLKYESRKMVTVFETHIKCHYSSYVNDACGAVYQRRQLREQYKGKDYEPFKRKFQSLLRDVLNVSESPWKSDTVDHDGVHYLRSLVLPRKKFANDNLQYDLKCCPQDYFQVLLGLTAMTEASEERPHLRNLFPIRTSLIPRYIRIDTTVLADLLLSPSERAIVKAKVKASASSVWEKFFHIKNSKDFHYMMETDGVATSLLYNRKNTKKVATTMVVPTESYLHELPVTTLQQLRTRKVVAIDPGMADLLSCVSETSTAETPEKLRYTQNQRRFDLKTATRAKQLQYEKNVTVLEGKSVTTHELELSSHNHKTVNLEAFQAYVKQKLLFNRTLAPFYSSYHFRKDRFNTFIDTQKSERSFLNDFKNKFGTPKDVVVAFGDWEQLHHRKYKEPVKGKGFRKMLRRDGYDVFLVDEHRTSVCCSSCRTDGSHCSKFRRRLDPNTKKSPSQRRCRNVHGLLVCNTCSRLWNRDINAPLNMNLLARECLEGRPRPLYLQRSRNASSPTAISTVSTITSTVHGIGKDVKIQGR